MKKGRRPRPRSITEIVLSDELFQKEYKKLKRYHTSKDPLKQDILKQRINVVGQRNKNLIAEINKDYYCGTCGSKDGRSHPDTSYCFYCDTDNWYPIHEDIGR